MKNAFLSNTLMSILLAGLVCSCGKKEKAAPDTAVKTQKNAEPQAPVSQQPMQESKTVKHEEPAAPAAAPERQFTGTAGGQPIIMSLGFDPEQLGRSSVRGWYYLESRGSGAKVDLSGSFQGGSLSLDQVVDGNVTASFEFTADPANKKSFLGSWKGQGKVLPARLQER